MDLQRNMLQIYGIFRYVGEMEKNTRQLPPFGRRLAGAVFFNSILLFRRNRFFAAFPFSFVENDLPQTDRVRGNFHVLIILDVLHGLLQ